jgi:GntR family transcriptional regulator
VTPLIVVDWSVDEPVYAQIARQIRAEIAAGGLAAGDVLPPVRTIASDLGVNLNTVARAYRLLEAEGFVAIEEREGVRVQAPARRATRGAGESLGEELAVLVARMRQAGLSAAEIRKRVDRELAQIGNAEGGRREAGGGKADGQRPAVGAGTRKGP